MVGFWSSSQNRSSTNVAAGRSAPRLTASILAAHDPLPTDGAFTAVFAVTAIVALGSGLAALAVRQAPLRMTMTR